MKRIAIAISFVCCTAAHAEFWDGNYLHEKLSGTQADQHIALGYIIGVSDALYGVVQCAPTNVSAGQVRDMVRNYINNTPAIRHRSADSIVTEVLNRLAVPGASWKGASTMTRDDIIKLAREAGFAPPDGPFITWGASDDQIQCFADLVAAVEREACAKVCEGLIPPAGPVFDVSPDMIAAACAVLIRARGQA